MDVQLGDIGYAIVMLDSLSHEGSSSSMNTEEQHLGVTKDELEAPKYTGITIETEPNGQAHYRASYYVYPNPAVRSQRQKIHVPKVEGGQGIDQKAVRDALMHHIKKTQRTHPQYEIDQNAGKPRADLNRAKDMDDGTPLAPSPYVGISIEPNQKRVYRAHFRIEDERVDLNRIAGVDGRDIEKVRQALVEHIQQLRQSHPGINISFDYGRLRSEVEAEKRPFPFTYMHYLMERSVSGALPKKRPKNKRKIFFSKNLITAQRECSVQNLVEQCELSAASTPYEFPDNCIAFCPPQYFFDSANTFNPMITDINTEILGISVPSSDAGPSNLEETEFSSLAMTLHSGVPCSYLMHDLGQSVLFAALEVDTCGALQTKMLIIGCCIDSKLPPLPDSIIQFLQNQHPEEKVQATMLEDALVNTFYIYTIIFFTIFTLYSFASRSVKRTHMNLPLLSETF